MADYQARGWKAWHHHMALVMIALMFLAKERLVHREITASMLSCHDLIDILRHKLPSKVIWHSPGSNPGIYAGWVSHPEWVAADRGN